MLRVVHSYAWLVKRKSLIQSVSVEPCLGGRRMHRTFYAGCLLLFLSCAVWSKDVELTILLTYHSQGERQPLRWSLIGEPSYCSAHGELSRDIYAAENCI